MGKQHLCPVWMGHLLANPLRKLRQHPTKLLSPYVSEGMCAMDLGCAMGFFSLPLAQMVGPEGRVICVDLQEPMLEALMRRARKANLDDHIEARTCGRDSLRLDDLAGTVDFALAFGIVHEVPEPGRFFADVAATLKPEGKLLFAEPKWPVPSEAFDASLALAGQHGFEVVERLNIASARAALLRKRPTR